MCARQCVREHGNKRVRVHASVLVCSSAKTRLCLWMEEPAAPRGSARMEFASEVKMERSCLRVRACMHGCLPLSLCLRVPFMHAHDSCWRACACCRAR
eukprot:1441050-Pleurochrysis_carterae.AAC.1